MIFDFRERTVSDLQSAGTDGLSAKNSSGREAAGILRTERNGGAEGSRTPDLLIANETLYQLSYDPIQKSRTISGLFSHGASGFCGTVQSRFR